MLIRRETLQAALPACTPDDTRYCLSKVQIRPTGECCATDGHIAIIAKDRTPMLDEDFPTPQGANIHGELAQPILLSLDAAKRLIDATKQRGSNRSIPVLGTIRVGRNGDESTAVLVGTDLQSPVITTVQADPNENFPILDRVMPKADKPHTVPMILSSEVLDHILKAAKAVQGRKPQQAIRFDVPFSNLKGVDCAIRVTVAGDETDIEAAIMPMRA